MTYLVAGLVLFFVPHSLRLFADDWRRAQIKRMGKRPWAIAYSVVSLVAFVFMAWGYGVARNEATDLWTPPAWSRTAAAVLTVPAFILLVAAYVRGNRIKAALGHPMMLGTAIWALAHLLSNGRLADLLLFGAFGVWAVLEFRAFRAEDRAKGKVYPVLGPARDAIAVVVGLAAWAAFAFYLHGPLIGTRLFA